MKIIAFGSNIVDFYFPLTHGEYGAFFSTGVGSQDAVHIEGVHQIAPGGKGANQAVAAAKAGGNVAFYGAVGSDTNGDYQLAALKQVGIDVSGILRAEGPTGMASIATDPNGKHRIFVSQAANRLAKANLVPDAALGPKTILLIQAELDLDETLHLAQRNRALGGMVVFNMAPARPVPPALISATNYLILNQPEAETLALQLDQDPADLEKFAGYVAKTYGATTIVTLGPDGAIAVAAGATDADARIRMPSLKIIPVDTVGAGDAFVGALTAALARGDGLEAAMEQGIVAGSLACTKMGAQTALPTQTEIMAAVPRLRTAKTA
jgi:ribokinase